MLCVKNNQPGSSARLPLGWLLVGLLLLSANASAKTDPTKLHIVQDHAWAPFAFRDRDGEPQGLLIDLWREVATVMEREVVFELYDWPETLERVRHDPDRVHGGLLMSSERSEYLAFSNSLLPLRTMFFVNTQGDYQNAQDVADLNGRAVGITAGGYEVTYMRSQYPGIALRTYNNNEQLVRAAVQGEVQAFVADYPVGMYYLNRFTSPSHFRILTQLYQRPLAAGIAKDNPELLEAVNQALEALPPERYAAIIQKWSHSDRVEVLPRWLVPGMLAGLALLLIMGLLLHSRIMRKKLQAQADQLREQDAHIDLLAQNMSDFAWIVSADGTMDYVSPSVINILGYQPEELIGQEMTAPLTPLAASKVYAMQANLVAAAKRGEYQGHTDIKVEIPQQHKLGATVWTDVSIRIFFTPEGEFAGAQGVSRDVTQRREAEEALRRLTLHDPLTNLPNRRFLTDRIAQMMANCEQQNQYCALLFLDLDNFKYFNDQYGHDGGDKLLQLVAERLQERLPCADTIARFGGDEFVVLTGYLGSELETARQQAEELGEKIIGFFATPFDAPAQAYSITTSIGITLFNNGDRSVRSCLKTADIAIYKAKSLGRGKLFVAE